jgi:hypothetical protein
MIYTDVLQEWSIEWQRSNSMAAKASMTLLIGYLFTVMVSARLIGLARLGAGT